MANLAGKVALVTGAARHRGLGRAIALRLARDGADLVVTGRYRAPEELPQNERQIGWTGVASLAAEIGEMGRQALALEADITVKAQVEQLVEMAKNRFGRIDILVNNAGVAGGAGDAPRL
jgi:NAD(P)-dependent dehydrogenase (short-subunit alcohol dehydrogenase family)